MISIINYKFYKNFIKFIEIKKKKIFKKINIAFNNIVIKHYITNSSQNMPNNFDVRSLFFFALNYNFFYYKHKKNNENLYFFLNKFV